MAAKKTAIVVVSKDELSRETRQRPGSDFEIKTGQWYYVSQTDSDPWLGCVTHVGSNYVKLVGPHNQHSSFSERVHIDKFLERCEPVSDPDSIIDKKIESYRAEAARLMLKVKEITARLAVTPHGELQSGNETQALAVRLSDQNYEQYEKALVAAKDKLLPDLFKEIKDAHDKMAAWMTGKVLPLEAQAGRLKSIIGKIDNRIFNVKLYAGLIESVKKIADGKPADVEAKIHLLQRRCYMDEECLADYKIGGMSFQGIAEFDKWLAEPKHRNRILPFPRSIVAFRVRRDRKEYEVVDIHDYFQFQAEHELNKLTFLYIRNGEQVYRLQTDIEFDEHLFPDIDKKELDAGGRLWAKMFSSQVEELLSENSYQFLMEEKKKKWKTTAKKDRWHSEDPSRYFDSYHPFDRSSVYYDDIARKIESEINAHNRIVLIIQGLLDRSPALHPHPPWQLWTAEGFNLALKLVYDDSRALSGGEKPDFEAYRKRLNASLKPGSITVGQQDAWERIEAVKESRRQDRDYRVRTSHRPTKFTPYGNPGPGELAYVAKIRGAKAHYVWQKERLSIRYYHQIGTLPAMVGIPVSKLFNVSAYKPGDFHQFFDDPRTRAEYLKWAPLLLEAEEYHAGNRKVGNKIGKSKE